MIFPKMSNIRLSQLLIIILSITLIPLIFVRDASAHKVQMFAYAEGEKVFVEGYFADGKKTVNSKVVVYDNISGEKLLSGDTDDVGKFSFRIPKKTDLKIELIASMGHKTEYVIPGNELSAGSESQSVSSDAGHTGTGSPASVNEAEIQLMIEQSLQKSIVPLLRGFSECKEQVFLSEIIGGIGYIVGILGIVFYFKARKNPG